MSFIEIELFDLSEDVDYVYSFFVDSFSFCYIARALCACHDYLEFRNAVFTTKSWGFVSGLLDEEQYLVPLAKY